MISFLQTFWPTLALLVGIAALFLLLRNRTTPIKSREDVVEPGRPVVVEIFSNT